MVEDGVCSGPWPAWALAIAACASAGVRKPAATAALAAAVYFDT